MSQPPPHSLIERLHREAVTLLNRGALTAADARCRELLALAPQHADARFLRGVVAAAAGSSSAALTFMRAAIELQPARAEYHAQLARCLVLIQEAGAALAAAKRALDCRPTDALSFDTIGNVLVRLNRHTEAVAAFRNAVALAPRNAGYQFNLATALKFLGEVAAAERAYEDCLAAAPQFWPAHSGLAQLRQQSPHDNHLERLLALQEVASRSADAELHLQHALAKEYEDLGDYARAFQHLTKGKAAKRAMLHDVQARDDALFDALEQSFATSLPAPSSHQCTAGPRPIFVVGMPRTGTTLVDRILSSHSQVESAGESPSFAILLQRALGVPAGSALDTTLLSRWRDIDFAALGAAYCANVQPLLGTHACFVDKMPHNFLYVPLIHLALPDAKIICLRRNPLDTCLSNFRQLFALDNRQYDYSYDLLDTGNHYVRFARLIERWRELLGEQMLEIHYEALVASQEATTRRMLEFCDLAWEPECLHFERNPTAVATASAMQVRARLHERAMNRWHHYARELESLSELLARQGLLLEGSHDERK
jgi:tetratricopeptide (TPR) repeat protein